MKGFTMNLLEKPGVNSGAEFYVGLGRSSIRNNPAAVTGLDDSSLVVPSPFRLGI
jgi:hypothetical protein